MVKPFRANLGVLVVFLFLITVFPCITQEPQASREFSSSLFCDGKTASFSLRLSQAGCVSISAGSKGRREKLRIWGPAWMDAGQFSITIPIEKVASKSGSVEFFTDELVPRLAIGRTGTGELQFVHPMGLGWDPTRKELYVADTGNDRIVRLGPDGRFIAQYGGFGLALGDVSEEKEDSLDAPWDVAPGGFSNFYVSDQNNDRICEFDAYKSFKGKFYPTIGDRNSRLSRPRGLSIDGENNIWVVDSRNDRVLKLAPSGAKLFELGGFGAGRWSFRDPTQVAVDDSGRIFVCDPGNHRVSVFDRLGSFISEIKDHLSSPTGIAIDPDGILSICDEVTGELGLYTPAGIRIFWMNGITESDRFRAPADVTATGRVIYLLDSGNNRVVILERRKTGRECTWQALSRVVK